MHFAGLELPFSHPTLKASSCLLRTSRKQSINILHAVASHVKENTYDSSQTEPEP